MQCPYCSAEMKPCGSVFYRGSKGPSAAEWVRCVQCGHATIARLKPVFAAAASAGMGISLATPAAHR